MFVGLAVVSLVVALITGVAAFVLLYYPDWMTWNQVLPEVYGTSETDSATDSLFPLLDFLVGIAGTTGSLGATFALAAIYLSQNRILDDQKAIQETQTKLIGHQNLPLLEVNRDLELHDNRPDFDPESRDIIDDTDHPGPWASVIVENYGDEAAEQIQLVSLIHLPDSDGTKLIAGIEPLAATRMTTQLTSDSGALVLPDGKPTFLRGRPKFGIEGNHGPQTTTFKNELLTQLYENEQRVRFGFVLIHTNSMTQPMQVKLNAYSIKPADISGIDKDDFTMTDLQDCAGSYSIEKLIHTDLDWSLSADEFSERTLDQLV